MFACVPCSPCNHESASVVKQCGAPEDRPAAWALLRGLCMGLPSHAKSSSPLTWPNWRTIIGPLTQACVATMQAKIPPEDRVEALITVRARLRCHVFVLCSPTGCVRA